MSFDMNGGNTIGTWGIEYKPKAREHKKSLAMWATYWPWSLIWTLLDDVVKRLINFAIRKLQRIYEAISDHSFRGTEKDFLDAEARARVEKALIDKTGGAQRTKGETTYRRGN